MTSPSYNEELKEIRKQSAILMSVSFAQISQRQSIRLESTNNQTITRANETVNKMHSKSSNINNWYFECETHITIHVSKFSLQNIKEPQFKDNNLIFLTFFSH